MTMNLAVAIIGLLVLVGLSVAVGVVDGRSRRAAWNRIAFARREGRKIGETLLEEAMALDVRRAQVDARGRTLDAQERILEARKQALDARAQALDARARVLDARERGTGSGPDAA